MEDFGTATGSRPRDVFSQAVLVVLKNWNALQIAVDNQFGGQFTREKAEWLRQVTADYFWENADLEPEEVEELLATLLNEEFDTIVEDGSLPMVSQQLCTLFQQCCNGDLQEEEPCTSVTTGLTDQKEPDQQNCSETQTTQQQAIPPATPPATPTTTPTAEEEGWEVVTKRRRRKH